MLIWLLGFGLFTLSLIMVAFGVIDLRQADAAAAICLETGSRYVAVLLAAIYFALILPDFSRSYHEFGTDVPLVTEPIVNVGINWG